MNITLNVHVDKLRQLNPPPNTEESPTRGRRNQQGRVDAYCILEDDRGGQVPAPPSNNPNLDPTLNDFTSPNPGSEDVVWRINDISNDTNHPAEILWVKIPDVRPEEFDGVNGVVTVPNSAFSGVNMDNPHEYTMFFRIFRGQNAPENQKYWHYYLDPKLGGHG